MRQIRININVLEDDKDEWVSCPMIDTQRCDCRCAWYHEKNGHAYCKEHCIGVLAESLMANN